MVKAVGLYSWTLSTALVMNGDYGVDVLTGPTTTDVLMMTILEYNVHRVMDVHFLIVVGRKRGAHISDLSESASY